MADSDRYPVNRQVEIAVSAADWLRNRARYAGRLGKEAEAAAAQDEEAYEELLGAIRGFEQSERPEFRYVARALRPPFVVLDLVKEDKYLVTYASDMHVAKDRFVGVYHDVDALPYKLQGMYVVSIDAKADVDGGGPYTLVALGGGEA